MRTHSRKILSLLLCITLVVGIFPTPILVSAQDTYNTWDEVAASAKSGIDYTLNIGNMKIRTAAGLAYFAQLVNSGKNLFKGRTVTLTDDIDLTTAGVVGYSGELDPDTGEFATLNADNSWTAIGTNTLQMQFAGTFDGQGHTVSGVYINAGYSEGLFGDTLTGSVIQNVGVIDSHIKGIDRVGGVVGLNNGTVQNCYNTGTISGTGNFVGGVVGSNNGTVQNCYNTGTVSGYGQVGGVVGSNYGTVQNCYNSGDVSGVGLVGGVAGNNNGTVQNCYFLQEGEINKDLSGIGNDGNGATNDGTSPNDTDSMQSEAFVTELDGWVSGQSNSALSGWMVQDSDYPTFDYSIRTWESAANDAVSAMDHEAINSAVFEIRTAKGLAWFMEDVNAGNDYDGVYVRLTGDIDLTDAGVTGYNGTGNTMDASVNASNSWPGIGTSSAPFSGIFDGQGFTVSGVYINDATASEKGLFGYIKMLKEEDDGEIDIISVGTIQNVSVKNSDIYGQSNIGGIVGQSEGGIVQSCYNTGDVSGANIIVGGIVGYNNGGTIQNSYNTSDVSGSGQIGGIVGKSNGTVQNCYSTGIVSGSGDTGIVIGYNDGGTVQSCYFLQENLINSTFSGIGNGDGTADAMDTDAMQNPDFTAKLNAWVMEQHNKDLRTWVTQDSDSPTFGASHSYWSEVGLSAVESVDYSMDSNGNVKVHTAVGLAWVAEQVNSAANQFHEKTITLTKDIDLMTAGVIGYNGDIDPDTGELANVKEMNSWPAIGFFHYNFATESSIVNRGFQGSFDGQGFTVSNVYINSTGSYKGLFGYAVDANIAGPGENPIMVGGTIENVGVINSHIKGDVFVSGIVGESFSTITNCYNDATVIGNDYVGGIAGNIQFGYPITNCYNTGDVSGNIIVGGIVGYNSSTIQNSYNIGAVSGETNVGGLVGTNSDDVKNSYNSGNVSGTTNVSGTIGNNSSNLYENIYYREGAVISGSAVEHGIAKTETELKSMEFLTELNDWVYDNKGTISGLYHWDNLGGTTTPIVRANGYKLTITGSDGIPFTQMGFAEDIITLVPEIHSDKVFESWTITPSTVVITDNDFTMPHEDVTIVGNYRDLLPQTLSFAQEEVKKTVGDDKFTNALTGEKTTVTYTSTNEDVAKINAQTGEVTIMSAGTTEIVATASADNTYIETSISYSLTVDSVKALTYEDITDYVASFNGEFDELAKIYFDGVELKLKQVNADTYELYGYPEGSSTIIGKAERGSIVITLYEEFLRTLPEGDYNLSVTFNGATLTPVGTTVVNVPEGAPEPEVEPEEETDVPTTGDDSNVALWVTFLFISVIGTAVVVKKKLVK